MYEGKTTEFDYGSGFINVYLPRTDGTIVDQRKVHQPSPIFTMEQLYKFSEDVLRDRHLFLNNKKPYFNNYLDQDFENQKDSSSKSVVSEEKDHLPPLNVVKLSIDASSQDLPKIRDKRFNERLSAYVKKKAQTEESSRSTKQSKTLEKKTNSILRKSPIETVTPRKPKLRRGLSFHSGTIPRKSVPIEFPRLTTSASNFDKQKTSLTLKTERTLWFPEHVIEKTYTKFGFGRNPARPSSKPNSIWRQSSDLLLKNTSQDMEAKFIEFPYGSRMKTDNFVRQKTSV